MELAAIIDPFTTHLIRLRRYRMAEQLDGAVLSIPCNLAEGNGRIHTAEYAHHVSMSRWSLRLV